MPTGREQLKQFAEDTIEELLHELPPERLLKGITTEERLKGLPTEEVLKVVLAEERVNGLTPEQLLKALSPEKRLELARLLNDDRSKGPLPRDAKPGESN